MPSAPKHSLEPRSCSTLPMRWPEPSAPRRAWSRPSARRPRVMQTIAPATSAADRPSYSRQRGRRWIYDFADGCKEQRNLLRGKGANIAEMTRVLGPDLVPAGFTITTEACVEYMRERHQPEGLAAQVSGALERLERRAGKRFGDERDPLLLSVRSGARASMPGMLDT